MRGIIEDLRTRALFLGLALLGTTLPASSRAADATMLGAQFEIAGKDCNAQIEAGKFDPCLNALQALASQAAGGETDAIRELKTRINLRIAVVEARKKAGTPEGERKDLYYRTIFKAYAGVPEKYFPYDEVLPLWNSYLREDFGRSKFARYRKLKLIARAPKEDKALEEAFFTDIQNRLLEMGFSLLDPTTTAAAPPDVLLKVNVKAGPADDITNPQLSYKKLYRLTMDITAFKFMSAGESVEPSQVEVIEGANNLDLAREQVVHKSSDRLCNLLFYHALRQMFQVSTPE